MDERAQHQLARGLHAIFAWRRVLIALGASIGIALMSSAAPARAIPVTVPLGFVAVFAFGVFEQWPRQWPRGIARWVVQVLAVALVLPLANAVQFALATPAGAPAFYLVRERMSLYAATTSLALLFAPWIALGALVRQRESFARRQEVEFELAKSRLEREALDARLRLLQAQVAPHFLFNTLANVQALVDTGSPRASELLRHLVTYLRAAVPRIGSDHATLGDEVSLVRAYLELMHMRMPDRLEFTLDVDADALAELCPPMALLTLVENAVRHGIDSSEEGGRIDVVARSHDGRCEVCVRDTGVGLRQADGGLGTGLSSLRERLRLVHGDAATLRVSEAPPRGVLAELSWPLDQRRTP